MSEKKTKMESKNPVNEAVSFFLHGTTSGLWGRDRADLRPEVQEVLLELEQRLQKLLEEFRDEKCQQKQLDTIT